MTYHHHLFSFLDKNKPDTVEKQPTIKKKKRKKKFGQSCMIDERFLTEPLFLLLKTSD